MNDGRAAVATEAEQRERYRESLEELRTILPGVQVLFAFLLTVPFAAEFSSLDRLGRDVFAIALLGTAFAAAVFMTPAAYHRLARDQDRDSRLRVTVRLTIVGMGLLALSVAAAVFVVARFIFDSTAIGVVFGASTALASGSLWFVLPLLRRAPR
jgi:hypothetical protein